MNRLLASICRFLWLPASQTPTGKTAARTFPSLLILAVCVYWWWTYSGLYRWIAELQLAIFESYFVIITLVFSFLVFIFPLGYLGARGEAAGWLGEDSSDADPNRFNVLAGLVTLAVMSLGVGWYTSQRIPHGESVELTLADVKRGRPIPGHVLLQGYGRPDFSIRLGGDASANYTALVPPDFVEGDRIAVYVEHQSPRDDEAMAEEWHRGVLIANGLPGLVREKFKTTNASPAEPHYLFCYAEAMDGLEYLPTIMFSIGGVLVFASLLAFYFAVR